MKSFTYSGVHIRPQNLFQLKIIRILIKLPNVLKKFRTTCD